MTGMQHIEEFQKILSGHSLQLSASTEQPCPPLLLSVPASCDRFLFHALIDMAAQMSCTHKLFPMK